RTMQRFTRMRRGSIVAAAVAVGAIVFAGGTAAAQSSGDRWVGTWAPAGGGRPQNPPPPAPPPAPVLVNARCRAPAAPPVPAPPRPHVARPPGQTLAPPPYVHFTNQTLRQIVHTSLGGSKARVVLSNAYGTAPVTIGAAHIAVRGTQASIQAGSGRPLTFSDK